MCLESPLLYRWNSSRGRVNIPAATQRSTALSAAGTTGPGLPGGVWHTSSLSERVSTGWRRAAASPSGPRHPKSPCMWAACLSVTVRFVLCLCVQSYRAVLICHEQRERKLCVNQKHIFLYFLWSCWVLCLHFQMEKIVDCGPSNLVFITLTTTNTPRGQHWQCADLGLVKTHLTITKSICMYGYVRTCMMSQRQMDTNHFSREQRILLADGQHVHGPAHGRGPEQGHHFFLALSVQVHSVDLWARAQCESKATCDLYAPKKKSLAGIIYVPFPVEETTSWLPCQFD